MPSAYRPVPDHLHSAEAGAHRVLDFESFFSVSLDLMVIRDSAFRIVKVNQAWERVLGYTAAELEGRPMLSFIHPDDAGASHAQMHRLEAEGDVQSFINRYRCRDGGYRYFEWRARQEGDLVYGVARDVTDRIAFEAEMAGARAAAEDANKAKSEFLANMSHEIRTPLNGVIGVAGALAETDLSQDQREMVDLILTSGHTLERVLSDVLELSKIEAGRLEFDYQPFDLRNEVEGLLELFRPRALEKGLVFDLTYGASADGWLRGDAVRIKQILGNLISNAVKFTSAGAITLTVDLSDTERPDIRLLTMEVRDTGIGFDEAFAERLFQRFSQADGSITRRFGGTGLGLSICQALVELMGGEIRAASVPGQGSRFSVSLPLGWHIPTTEPPIRPSEHVVRPKARPAPLRILLAEDHLVNQRVVELILAPAGVALTKVENGADALQACKNERFDLVLMDMQMPVMDGLAATRLIRELETRTPERPLTPIIMLTANAMRQHQEQAAAAGANLHLAKPITPVSLFSAIGRLLNGTDT